MQTTRFITTKFKGTENTVGYVNPFYIQKAVGAVAQSQEHVPLKE
jgi:hypothetical protein